MNLSLVSVNPQYDVGKRMDGKRMETGLSNHSLALTWFVAPLRPQLEVETPRERFTSVPAPGGDAHFGGFFSQSGVVGGGDEIHSDIAPETKLHRARYWVD